MCTNETDTDAFARRGMGGDEVDLTIVDRDGDSGIAASMIAMFGRDC